MKPYEIFRIVISTLIAGFCMACVPIGFWLSGFNFDARGPTAVTCFLTTLITGPIAFAASMLMTSGD